jgi:hypothetical protein
MVFDLLGRGMFNDPDTGRISRGDRAKILEMVELGNWEGSNDVDQEHINRAQRENLYLEKGQAPTIFEYDDDMLHVREHLKYMLTTDYEELASKDTLMHQAMLMHLKQHEASYRFKMQPSPEEMLAQAQTQSIAAK